MRCESLAFVLALLCFVGIAHSPPLSAQETIDPTPGSEGANAEAPTPASLRSLIAESKGAVPSGVWATAQYHLEQAKRMAEHHPKQAPKWRSRARQMLQSAKAGGTPLLDAKGKIINRGYRSELSTRMQGYAVYTPADYDPNKSYPLYVALHGGSSNGNLFLGVFLGNNMNWKTYKEHLYDEFVPQYHPDWIVVAPTGFGQIIWRWMGERDVFDVIKDVKKHYSVDPHRVVLGGVSNGGKGAYTIGSRHASKFSLVQAMAGAPSWVQYVGGPLRPEERTAIKPLSGMHLIENAFNTDFRYYHGRKDKGPMRPAFVDELRRKIKKIDGLTVKETWFDLGHDILYFSTRRTTAFPKFAKLIQQQRPSEVRLVSGDYRAASQHWLAVTRFVNYPQLARVRGVVSEGTVEIEANEQVGALALDLRQMPLTTDAIVVKINGDLVYEGVRKALGDRFHLVREGSSYTPGFPSTTGLRKVAGLSGPVSDAFFDKMIHVYGTQGSEADTEILKAAATRGARGWPLWSWDLQQQVVADTELTDDMVQSAHIVLYATPKSNAVYERIKAQLPIHITEDGVVVGAETHPKSGVRYIYPNPLSRRGTTLATKYVLVQGAPTAQLVNLGNKLPEFGPDWVVYNKRSLRGTQQRIFARRSPVALGFFDDRWQLPGAPSISDAPRLNVKPAEVQVPPKPGPKIPIQRLAPAGPQRSEWLQFLGERPYRGAGDEDAGVSETPTLPVPKAPRVPRMTSTFLVSAESVEGEVARKIARNVRTFHNFRAEIPGANWVVKKDLRWSIRPADICMAELESLSVPARKSAQPLTPVPVPVELMGPVEGVWFRSVHEDRPVVIACEMAARLPLLAKTLKAHGFTGVEVLSSYRNQPRPSFHTMGMALDINRLWTDKGWLSVFSHYAATPMAHTCSASSVPKDRRAKQLRAFACDLWSKRIYSSILTPNYNEGHRDHFHIDIRPDDPRFFLR